MATQRYISTSFWDDPWIHRLDPSEKFLFLYLMTNPLTNIAGIYKLDVDRIVYDTGFNEHTVKHVLGRFAEARKALMYGEYVIIRSWPKHQKISKSQTIKIGIEAILSQIPKDVLFVARKMGYEYDVDRFLIGYTYRPSYSDSDLNSDLDLDFTPKPPVGGSPPPQPVPEKPSKPEVKPSKLTAAEDLYQKVLDYLNFKLGRTGPADHPFTAGGGLRARIDEGYSFADFKAVIDDKYAEWWPSQKMRRFLKPPTLFRPGNFGDYLRVAKDPRTASAAPVFRAKSQDTGAEPVEAGLL